MEKSMSATKTQALLEEARQKLGGVTDYKLAQVMQIPRQRVSEYRLGKWQADNYACARIAEILEKDALEIIAAVEAENAKTEERRSYWRSFRGTGRTAILGLLLSGISAFSGLGSPVGNAEAAPAVSSHNVYYVK
jgi:transcriptional regulator with XRE-family HTH domain